jgi:quinol monooxygenase YgiN
MLDPRVRTALHEFQQGRRSLEEAAQLLAQVRRERGCLELYPSASSGAAERALLARFAELVAEDGGAGSARGAPVV